MCPSIYVKTCNQTNKLLSTLVCFSQILLKMESSLKFQIHYEYDKTGTSGNLTTADTDHVTVLVDAMQRKVSMIERIRCPIQYDGNHLRP